MRVRIMRPTNIEYRARLVFSGECRVSMSHRCTPDTSMQRGLLGRAHAANSCSKREPQIANETPDPGDQAFCISSSSFNRVILLLLLFSFSHVVFRADFKFIIFTKLRTTRSRVLFQVERVRSNRSMVVLEINDTIENRAYFTNF